MNAISPSLILAVTLAASLAQGSIVVVQRTETIPANGAPTIRVDCPAGMHALSGGIIPGNVFQAEVAANGPVYGAALLQYMQYGPAAAPTGWYGLKREEQEKWHELIKQEQRSPWDIHRKSKSA